MMEPLARVLYDLAHFNKMRYLLRTQGRYPEYPRLWRHHRRQRYRHAQHYYRDKAFLP